MTLASALASAPLVVTAEGWCGRRFCLHDPNASTEGRLDLSWWKESATVSIEGRTFAFTRSREPGRPWTFSADGEVLARAFKPSLWRSAFQVHFGDERLELRPRNLWMRTFQLWRGEELIGEVMARGWFDRRATLHLPSDWPLPLPAFVFFLVRLIWNRQLALAAS